MCRIFKIIFTIVLYDDTIFIACDLTSMLLSRNVTQTYSLGPIRSSLETLRFELHPLAYIEQLSCLLVYKNGQIEQID